jgi:hypothetical protein
VDVTDDRVHALNMASVYVSHYHVDLLRNASEDFPGKDVDQRDPTCLEIPENHIASPQRPPENAPFEQVDDTCRSVPEIAFAMANPSNPLPLEVSHVSGRRCPDRLSFFEHFEDLLEFLREGTRETLTQQARDRIVQSKLQEP